MSNLSAHVISYHMNTLHIVFRVETNVY